MFDRLLQNIIGIDYLDKILIKDYDGIIKKYDNKFKDKYKSMLYEYNDIEKFRYFYEKTIKNSSKKYIVVVYEKIYIPYDIEKFFNVIDLNYSDLFPKLNTFILKNVPNLNLDLLTIAYENLYENLHSEAKTKDFLDKTIYEKNNVEEYILELKNNMKNIIEINPDYGKWFLISSQNAMVKYLQFKSGYKFDSDEFEKEIENAFRKFILKDYGKLSGRNSNKTPILLNKVMDFIFMSNENFMSQNKKAKIALIVMDGMSVVDWQVVSEEFKDIIYEVNYSFALIPTLTCISRQSLFSGKLPVQIENPFNLSKEKNLFIEKCMEYGYKDDEIKYFRGYDIDLSVKDKCIGIIINDIDDLVHNQLQGYSGMYRDVKYLAQKNLLQDLIKRLDSNGFDIYITSDHGNTAATGIGKITGAGIEIETKSQRVVVLKDFVDEENMKNKFNLIEYPSYYLKKDNKYLICEDGEALASKGEKIVSHGGISIEEVIVPFITIKGVKNE